MTRDVHPFRTPSGTQACRGTTTPPSGRAPRRLAWPDAARGLAIGLVVLYHATNWTWSTGYEVSVLRDFNETLRSLRMPLFFAVAGMFAGKWMTVPWSRLARGKLLFFAWVFVLWEPISLVVRLLTGYYQVADADWGTLCDDLAWSLLVPRSELLVHLDARRVLRDRASGAPGARARAARGLPPA